MRFSLVQKRGFSPLDLHQPESRVGLFPPQTEVVIMVDAFVVRPHRIELIRTPHIRLRLLKPRPTCRGFHSKQLGGGDIMSVKVIGGRRSRGGANGVRASLFSGTDITIVAEASSGAEAVKMAVQAQAGCRSVGHPHARKRRARRRSTRSTAKLPGTRRWWCCRRTTIPTYVARAVALGASDYVLKGASRQELISTITAAAEGKSPFNVPASCKEWPAR